MEVDCNEQKFLCAVIGPISKPNDYLNTVFYDVVSLRMELQTPPPPHPQGPHRKSFNLLQFSLPVCEMSFLTTKEYTGCMLLIL